MNILKKSLAARFSVALFAILVAGQMLGGAWFLYEQRIGLRDSADEKVEGIGRLLANTSSSALKNFDYEAISTLLESVMQDDQFMSITVSDQQGTIAEKSQAASRNPGKEQSGGILFLPDFETRDFPIGGQNEVLGNVRIRFSNRKINADLSQLLSITPLFLGLLLLVAGILIFVFFQRNVAAPLEDLNARIERVGQKDLSVNFSSPRVDEIGQLIRWFQFLVDRLRGAMERVNTTSVDVAMAIKQMEQTFESVEQGTREQFHAVEVIETKIGGLDAFQREIGQSTDTLRGLFQENLASLQEVRATMTEIVNTTGELFGAIDDAYAAVSQASQSAREITSNAEDLNRDIEETSTAVDEIDASIREVEGSAKQSSDAARDVERSAVDTGKGALQEAVEGMENIRQEVVSSSEIVQRLGHRSKDIEKVLLVIKEVTEQTNLLSLNAAILASQAGEYGKGFGIVADQIGKLADRTAMSTREIAGIIRTIRKEITEAVESAERGLERVTEGGKLVERVGKALDQIADRASQAVQSAAVIERATSDQTQGIRLIAAAVDRVRQMTEHMARALVEQDQGHNRLVRIVGDVKGVAEVVKKGMEEQNRGVQMIARNLEITNERIGLIANESLRQRDSSRSIVEGIGKVRETGERSSEIIESMREGLATLYRETEAMRREVEEFKLR